MVTVKRSVLDQVSEAKREKCPIIKIEVGDYIFDEPRSRWFNVASKVRITMKASTDAQYMPYWQFVSDAASNTSADDGIADGAFFAADDYIVRRVAKR